MRYCVNATVVCNAWAFVEAEDAEDALEKARSLDASDFETGDQWAVGIEGVERDA